MKNAILYLAIVLLAATASLFAQDFKTVKGTLIGYEEVPSICTGAKGTFQARINNDETEIQYELSYSGLEDEITQAHIHFAQRGVNGGITVFLCTDLGNGPAGTQECPSSPATITATIRAADASPDIPATAAARAQGLDTGEFAEFIRALRAGKTYVNVHTEKFPGGEIRKQVAPRESLNHHSHR